MTQMSANTTVIVGAAKTRGPLLRGVPFGVPLVHGRTAPDWGCWGVIEDRPLLATGGADGSVRVWDPATGQAISDLRGHTGSVRWGAWGVAGDRPVLATGGVDRTVRLWDPLRAGRRITGQAISVLTGHTGFVDWGAWGVAGGRPVLATGGSDRTVRLWDPITGQEIRELTEHTASTDWGAWGVAGDRPVLATGSANGRVWLWNAISGQMIRVLTDRPNEVAWGAWGLASGRPVLASGGGDATVRLWDPITGQEISVLRGHTHSVSWGAWNLTGDRPVLATGDASGSVRLWDPATSQAIGDPLTDHTAWVQWGVWSVIGNRPILATGGSDGTARLWDPTTGQPIGDPLAGHTGSVAWGAWGLANDRPILATGGADDSVRWWEVIEEWPIGGSLPPYRSDAPTNVDELDRTSDAIAVAELITARSARPPLAVGLFGDWGEGKSHFLSLLQSQVEATIQTGNPLVHTFVRQARFNAWHYAETDLWASLITELFAQLAAPSGAADEFTEQRRQSRLAAELIAKRGLPQRLAAARARRDELRAALKEPAGLWSSLPPDQQQQLRTLVGEKPEKVYAQAAQTAGAIVGAGRVSWRMIRGIRLVTIARLASLITLLLALAASVVWWLPPLGRWAAALPGIAMALLLIQAAARFVSETRRRGSTMWKTAVSFGAQQRQRLVAAADAADAEVSALEREVRDFTAAGQLAGVVADRAASGDYRSQLGMMSRIRQDFAHMSRLLSQAAGEPVDAAALGRPVDTPAPADAAGDQLPRIDRIVVYIDDLDRCPPRRVVEMLEAVHLLLAVDLFVVVVAVDPRWLLSAIAAHYRDVLETTTSRPDPQAVIVVVDPDDETLWQSSPAQYLEKIFQLILTLPPLDTGSYQRMLGGLVSTREDRATRVEDTDAITGGPGPSPAGRVAAAGMNSAAAAANSMTFEVRLPAARVVERIDPFALDPDEVRLLNLLGPPLFVSTPRQVKRLANSYGLLAADGGAGGLDRRRVRRIDAASERPEAARRPATRPPRRGPGRARHHRGRPRGARGDLPAVPGRPCAAHRPRGLPRPRPRPVRAPAPRSPRPAERHLERIPRYSGTSEVGPRLVQPRRSAPQRRSSPAMASPSRRPSPCQPCRCRI